MEKNPVFLEKNPVLLRIAGFAMNQQALIDAFLDGLCKELESDHEIRGLSHLLARLPDPSLSQGQVEAVPVTVARERGVIPEASNETLPASSFSDMKL